VDFPSSVHADAVQSGANDMQSWCQTMESGLRTARAMLTVLAGSYTLRCKCSQTRGGGGYSA